MIKFYTSEEPSTSSVDRACSWQAAHQGLASHVINYTPCLMFFGHNIQIWRIKLYWITEDQE